LMDVQFHDNIYSMSDSTSAMNTFEALSSFLL